MLFSPGLLYSKARVFLVLFFFFFFGLSSFKINHMNTLHSLTLLGWCISQQQPQIQVLMHAIPFPPFNYLSYKNKTTVFIFPLPSNRGHIHTEAWSFSLAHPSPAAPAVLRVKDRVLWAGDWSPGAWRSGAKGKTGAVGGWKGSHKGGDAGCKPNLQWPPTWHSFFQPCCHRPRVRQQLLVLLCCPGLQEAERCERCQGWSSPSEHRERICPSARLPWAWGPTWSPGAGSSRDRARSLSLRSHLSPCQSSGAKQVRTKC